MIVKKLFANKKYSNNYYKLISAMEKYESKQVQISRPSCQVYESLSDLSRFTPLIGSRVDGWQADQDTCSFKIEGFTMRLRIVERIAGELIKIEGEDGSPFDFTFWMQLKEAAPSDTRMKLVLHVKLNMVMKMMIGGKLSEGMDKIAEQIALGFNSMPHSDVIDM